MHIEMYVCDDLQEFSHNMPKFFSSYNSLSQVGEGEGWNVGGERVCVCEGGRRGNSTSTEGLKISLKYLIFLLTPHSIVNDDHTPIVFHPSILLHNKIFKSEDIKNDTPPLFFYPTDRPTILRLKT